MSIPSQSQSSPIIHFTNTVRHGSSPLNGIIASPSTSIDYDSQQQFAALGARPQSTPILLPRGPENILDSQQSSENFLTVMKSNKRRRLTIFEHTSLTNVTPLIDINNRIRSPVLLQMFDEEESDDRYHLRPPPLMVLSQSIQAKHPEQILETKLSHRFSSTKDLPNSPANYSFVFYGFTTTQIEESKRLTRRMGDCFTSDLIDLTTTHVIVPADDPRLPVTLEFILALIYGCRVVTLEWLKSSSRIGEWLRGNKFEPKEFFQFHSSLNIYRRTRQQTKPTNFFQQCGLIYLTSLVQQRQLLVQLITILGGNITVNRDRAEILIGQSSKVLQIVPYSHVNEQWAIDSIQAGKCLPLDSYFLVQ